MMTYLSWYIGIGSLLAVWSWNAHGSKVLEARSAGFKFACYLVYILIWPIAVVAEVVRMAKKK